MNKTTLCSEPNMVLVQSFENFSGGYNPKTGFFISRTVLDGDYYKDVNKIVEGWVDNMYVDPKLMEQFGKGAGKFEVVSLKSYDGTNENIYAPPERELPDNFKYTPAYYSSPNLKKVIDWFQCEKTRVRVFRQLPGKNVELHHDFDNEREDFSDENIMLRVFMPLTDRDAYLNLANENSDIMVKLVKGQFAIINVDTVWHGSITFDNEPRDWLNMIVKWNPWLHELTRAKPIVGIERIKL